MRYLRTRVLARHQAQGGLVSCQHVINGNIAVRVLALPGYWTLIAIVRSGNEPSAPCLHVAPRRIHSSPRPVAMPPDIIAPSAPRSLDEFASIAASRRYYFRIAMSRLRRPCLRQIRIPV